MSLWNPFLHFLINKPKNPRVEPNKCDIPNKCDSAQSAPCVHPQDSSWRFFLEKATALLRVCLSVCPSLSTLMVNVYVRIPTLFY